VFNIPRGTRDFTPEDMQKRRYVEASMHTVFQSFGYQEIQTPMFETLELFTAKSGEGIMEELYSFTDKGNRDLALRPELTAPVMRFYVDKLQMQAKPLKLFYFGNCFRYDRPQKGRYREFRQAGCEIIGTDTPEAYAELIALAYNLLKNVGLKEITVNIGNLNILASMFAMLNLSKEKQKQLIPLIDKAQFDAVSDLLQDVGVNKEEAKRFLDVLQTSEIKEIEIYVEKNEVAKQELVKLKAILKLLSDSFKIKKYQIKMSIVRGLDYYKGIVFEMDASSLGAEKQLCGGGAYELISLFGGRETPTAGFAIGFDRTILALETEKYQFPSPTIDVYIIPVNGDMMPKALEIAQQLREHGTSTDIDLLRRGIGKSLKYASTVNAKKAIIIGSKELKESAVTVRDMKSGKQELVKIKDLH
jgi:histidyl-tRNA synthetase